MSVNDKNHYHKIIREMIKNENELRNSRSNWYIVIQSFLFTGVCKICSEYSFSSINTPCDDAKNCLLLIGVLIGLVTFISFLFVAWRSEKAIAMAMSAWDLFLAENKFFVKKYPPVCLMTDSIIGEKNPPIDNIGIKEWIENMNVQMYPKGKECEKCKDKIINKFELLMPFKFIPVVFIIVWSLIFYCLV